MHLIGPDAILGLTRPQQTSRESSPLNVLGLSLDSVKGLSAMRVIAAPPPRLPGLGVEIYLMPCTSRASSTLLT